MAKPGLGVTASCCKAARNAFVINGVDDGEWHASILGVYLVLDRRTPVLSNVVLANSAGKV
jgi:hypothetical protein